jgi:hypothetical protein
MKVSRWLKKERLINMLVGAKLLGEWDEHDKKTINAVLWQAIELWIANEEQKQRDRGDC